MNFKVWLEAYKVHNLLGEWWILPSGEFLYADADFEAGHDEVATNWLRSKIAKKKIRNDDDWYEWKDLYFHKFGFSSESAFDSRKSRELEQAREAGGWEAQKEVYAKYRELYNEIFKGINKEDWDMANEHISDDPEVKDNRDYMMKKYHWKRARESVITTWNFDPQDRQIIYNGVNNILKQTPMNSQRLKPGMDVPLIIDIRNQGSKEVQISLKDLITPAAPQKDFGAMSSGSGFAGKQLRDLELNNPKQMGATPMHPAYQRKGVAPIGDWTL